METIQLNNYYFFLFIWCDNWCLNDFLSHVESIYSVSILIFAILGVRKMFGIYGVIHKNRRDIGWYQILDKCLLRMIWILSLPMSRSFWFTPQFLLMRSSHQRKCFDCLTVSIHNVIDPPHLLTEKTQNFWNNKLELFRWKMYYFSQQFILQEKPKISAIYINNSASFIWFCAETNVLRLKIGRWLC